MTKNKVIHSRWKNKKNANILSEIPPQPPSVQEKEADKSPYDKIKRRTLKQKIKRLSYFLDYWWKGDWIKTRGQLTDLTFI